MPKVLIGGGSGLIGTRFSELLRNDGFEVAHLSRSASSEGYFPTFQWDVKQQMLDLQALEGVDYIVNFAGAGIADRPWTDKRKQEIIRSRTDSNKLLAKACQDANIRPKAFLSASAIGYYDNRGDEIMTEDKEPGNGFLAKSTIAWEESLASMKALDVPTSAVRIGLVLSYKAKSLENLLLPVKFGTAPYFGNGRQWMSWIHIDDLCGIFRFLLTSPSVPAGIYNGVAPNPHRMKDFMKILGQTWERPAFSFPVPAFTLRLGMGEMADIILGSTRVSSEKIEAAGFTFKFPDLKQALVDIRERKV